MIVVRIVHKMIGDRILFRHLFHFILLKTCKMQSSPQSLVGVQVIWLKIENRRKSNRIRKLVFLYI